MEGRSMSQGQRMAGMAGSGRGWLDRSVSVDRLGVDEAAVGTQLLQAGD